MAHRVVAIDGPAASGKSSVARQVAQRLGFAYVNSGAMYRAVTWQVLRRGIDPTDSEAVARVLDSCAFKTELAANEAQLRIDDEDPTPHLNEERVNQCVSTVSSVPRVREILVAKMRGFAEQTDLVMEGRDIG